MVINEVEINPIEDGEQWVELYNSGDEDVDVSGWSVTPLSNPENQQIIDDAIIPAGGFYVLSSANIWLDRMEETLILEDLDGIIVDRTPKLSDLTYSTCAWTRYPDGSPYWSFMEASRGEPASGIPCEEEEVKLISFAMDKQVSGSGFVNIRNSITSSDGTNMRSEEHGSGSYKAQEITKYSADLLTGTYAINLNKSDLALRYSDTAFNVSSKRSVRHSSRWTEASSMGGIQNSPCISESHRYSTRIDSDIMIQSSYSAVKANIGTEFEGVSRIRSNLYNLRSSEEYIGSFKVLNNYGYSDSSKVELSATGEGYVSTNRRLGDAVRTYEQGTGVYQAEAVIDPTRRSVAKDVNLLYSPVSYSYSPRNTVNRSILWKEGIRAGEKDVYFFSTEFSDIRKLADTTMVMSSGNVRTSSDFSGKARLQTGFKATSPTPGYVYMDEEYAGNYSIDRRIAILPIYRAPHITLSSSGRVEKPGCDVLRYTIVVINDGNRALGPIYVRDSFPSGTRFLSASPLPFELGARYANWSIPYLGAGESTTIDLDLQISSRRENYTNRVRAITVYQEQKGRTIRERRLRASNTSMLQMDWSNCTPMNLSVRFTVAPEPDQPRLLHYQLMVQNLAKEDISAVIAVSLPQHAEFINSTRTPSEIREDGITWEIDKLSPGRRRTISFLCEVDSDGLFVSHAYIQARSLEGRELASINATAPIILGKVVVAPTAYSDDWLPCGEKLPESMVSIDEAMDCCV
ncbi:MAG: lamin tail domain-containing protein [Methanothrix sp.]